MFNVLTCERPGHISSRDTGSIAHPPLQVLVYLTLPFVLQKSSVWRWLPTGQPGKFGWLWLRMVPNKRRPKYLAPTSWFTDAHHYIGQGVWGVNQKWLQRVRVVKNPDKPEFGDFVDNPNARQESRITTKAWLTRCKASKLWQETTCCVTLTKSVFLHYLQTFIIAFLYLAYKYCT